MTEADRKMLELSRLRRTDPRYSRQAREQYMKDIEPYKKQLEARGIKWTEEWRTKWDGKNLSLDEMEALSDSDFVEYYAILQTRKAKEQMQKDKAQREAAEKAAARKRMEQERRDFSSIDAYVLQAEARAKAANSVSHTDFGLG